MFFILFHAFIPKQTIDNQDIFQNLQLFGMHADAQLGMHTNESAMANVIEQGPAIFGQEA
ncbi:hypothetical protein [Phaeodactylibacter luteus]|uniref:Uncharacterized protein n=1 Tax=Phaeodactylibacter luteus TaxID=1564516 RepID=A0A5C6RR44_9BACT|nr:hypothetical protein [Phaeodactylibacter luteus]TXB64459.1 hypothetical protein FRY97_07105 [Phaeodactylibacter luteus]